ncbi:1,4-alpha-glucan branching protein [Streptantibioticus rubrisoli]|uniref:1,4-alpha-glucan branching protein n=1 Tax=Streptantibioticus rubrisoli TaxID=1387313 RepID=A0ABT1P822_9ACTN|nr:1,4-alpha-glucan branching protein [Streptantibioticus rubrisoli]MCQ4041513.1 1,4-alpha-glucan branching protein [Streptantibioticus rubrisoli]
MSIIHRTTLTPSKLELLSAWLPAQPWHLGAAGRTPELSKVGGFRLDDPRGEVGIEFMAATDGSGDSPVTYHAPLTYRGAPLDKAEHALLGTTEHGVLGRRWVYDGVHDPVLVTQLLALIAGRAEPQAQSVHDTPDPTVTSHFAESGRLAPDASWTVADGPHGTDLLVRTGDRQLRVRVNRVLRPEQGEPQSLLGHVTANWRLADGSQARGLFAAVHEASTE